MIGGIFFVAVVRWRERRRLRKRRERGVKAEQKAAWILRRHGYVLTDVQPSRSLKMTVDGTVHSYDVRPDGFARRGRERFVVEVKTGGTAPNPLYGETRRQLLEYYFGLPVDGILLVDGDRHLVSRIHFGRRRVSKFPKRLVFATFGLGVGSGMALFYLLSRGKWM